MVVSTGDDNKVEAEFSIDEAAVISEAGTEIEELSVTDTAVTSGVNSAELVKFPVRPPVLSVVDVDVEFADISSAVIGVQSDIVSVEFGYCNTSGTAVLSDVDAEFPLFSEAELAVLVTARVVFVAVALRFLH